MDRQADRTTHFQDLALAVLRRAVAHWERLGSLPPDYIGLIEREPAFSPALRARPEFQQILRRK